MQKTFFIWTLTLSTLAPGLPKILPLESTSESNTITVVWEASNRGGPADGYVLEIDDGNMGAFRVNKKIVPFLYFFEFFL